MSLPSKFTKVEKTFYVEDGEKRGPLTMFRVRFHPREAKLLAQCADRRLALFDLAAEPSKEIKGRGKAVLGELVCAHEIGWVRGFDFHPLGHSLATGGSDRTLRVWRWENGRPAETPTQQTAAHTGWIDAVAFSPDGQRIVTASGDQTVKVWDAANLKPIKTLTGHTRYVDDLLFTPDGRFFLTGGEDGKVIAWDAKTLEPQRAIEFGGVNEQFGQIPSHSGVHRLAISHDSRWLAVAGGDRTDVFDFVSGEIVATEKVAMQAAFHPTANVLAAGESEAKFWSYEPAQFAAPAKDKNGKPLAAKGLPGKLLTSVKRGEWSLGLRFSSDGSQVALGKADGTVEIYTVT